MENAEDADDEENTEGGDYVEDTNDADDTDNVEIQDNAHNEQHFESDPLSKAQNADRASKPAQAATTRAYRMNHSQSPPSG